MQWRCRESVERGRGCLRRHCKWGRVESGGQADIGITAAHELFLINLHMPSEQTPYHPPRPALLT